MRSMIVGFVAICLALWGLVSYKWYMVDILIGAFPLVLLIFGIVALLAGIKNTGLDANRLKRNCKPGSTSPATKRKDE